MEKCANIVSISGTTLQWVSECSVYFKAGRVFNCSFTHAKNSFFRSLNCILNKVFGSASEELFLSLTKSKCLPYLLYGTKPREF